jgi:predicted lipid-binding transport protein (Tim44 family)
MTIRIDTKAYGFPRTLLGRIVGGLLAAGLLVLAFFFVFLFLLAAGILILGIGLRMLWRKNQVRAQAAQDAIEGEYSVESQDKAADITHKR